jgi:hypothetical protein
MSTLLEIVHEARELRDEAERAFRLALVRAKARHSLREIAGAAGLSFAGVRWLIQRERGEIDGHGKPQREDKP